MRLTLARRCRARPRRDRRRCTAAPGRGRARRRAGLVPVVAARRDLRSFGCCAGSGRRGRRRSAVRRAAPTLLDIEPRPPTASHRGPAGDHFECQRPDLFLIPSHSSRSPNNPAKVRAMWRPIPATMTSRSLRLTLVLALTIAAGAIAAVSQPDGGIKLLEDRVACDPDDTVALNSLPISTSIGYVTRATMRDLARAADAVRRSIASASPRN